MAKTASYLKEPHPTLPGVLLEIPVNRKARRIENRKKRQERSEDRYVVTAFPLIRIQQGLYRISKGDKFWRISRRDFVRLEQGKIGKKTFVKKMKNRRLYESGI